MIVLTTAIVIPMISRRLDLVWFGIFVVLVVEMAEGVAAGRLQSVLLQTMSGHDSTPWRAPRAFSSCWC